jgi:hypothetical protein
VIPARAIESLDPPLAPATPKPVADISAPSSAKKAPASDPGLQPRRAAAGADLSGPSRTPSSLDPPVRPGGDVTAPTRGRTTVGAIDPPVEKAGAQRARGAVPLTAEQKRAQTRRVLGTGVAGLAVFVVLLRVLTAPATTVTLSETEARALADAWLAGGVNALGGRRADDAVTRAVERVARSLQPGLAGIATAGELRAVVVGGLGEGRLMTLPDGTMVVDQALLTRLKTEAELAALMAHALAHLVRGDVAAQLAPSMKSLRSSMSSGASVVASTMSAALGQGFDAAGEPDVDRLALKILRQAGWNPRHYDRALEHVLAPPQAAWAVQHAVTASRAAIAERLEPNGRSGGTEYTRDVLRPLGADVGKH